MEFWTLAISYALPIILAGVFAFCCMSGLLFAAYRPIFIIVPLLLILFWVTDISYGQVIETGGSIYSRGSGLLVFPALVWGLIITLGWLRFLEFFNGPSKDKLIFNINKWFVAWLVLLFCHLMVAIVLDVSLIDAVGPSGFSNWIVSWLFMLLLLKTVRDEKDVRLLLNFILIVGVSRATFGLVRWAAFGGDPSNAYANRHGLSLNLTFFDVYDGLVCMLTICVAVMRLFPLNAEKQESRTYKLLLVICIVLCVACVLLSFRRSAMIGMFLGGVFLLYQIPKRARWSVIFAGMPLALAGAAYTVWKRLSQTRLAGDLSGFLFDITPQNVGPDTPRLLELRLAWESLQNSPITGIGSWAGYDHWQLVSWQLYEGGGGAYLHSGVLHIALKAGLIGLVLFFGVIWSHIRFWNANQSNLYGDVRVLAVLGMVGCLFVIPDFVIGTSITKYRAMLMIGFCLATPYIAVKIKALHSRKSEQLPVDAPNFSTRSYV
jgi:O-Antigen ligase